MKLRVMEFLVAVFAAAGVYCGFRYYTDIYKPEKQLNNAINEQLELFSRIRPNIQPKENETDVQSETQTQLTENSPPTVENSSENIIIEPKNEFAENPLALCEEVNDRTVGWIYIPDTHVDYPIVQGDDNEFYLHNGVDGQYNYELGCPFLDYRCEGDFSGLGSIVFAHNIEGRAMFADIALFKEESFMQSHNAGYLTLEDGIHTVEFFAFLTVPSSAEVYRTNFYSEQEKADYVDYIYKFAKYSQDMGVDETSHLLLLSTCTFEYDEARGVLVGVIR